MQRFAALVSLLRSRSRQLFAGEVSATPLSLFRIGLASIVLVRTTDFLRPWLNFDHHAWTRGIEFSPRYDRPLSPELFSPLLPLPDLPDQAREWLADARTALAFLLLLGVRTRLSALLLFAVGYGLLALDRYRYFHHTHLIWASCLWLALCPGAHGFSLARLASRSRPAQAPRWSLQLLRAQCLIVYASAAVAKLGGNWLSGRTLASLAQAGLVGGPLFRASEALLGIQALAVGVAASELALVILLAHPRLRLLGLLLGLGLHTALGVSMVVSTFGAQMALYLMLFLPWETYRADRVSEGGRGLGGGHAAL